MPQQMAIRNALEAGAMAHVVRETELSAALAALVRPPALVVHCGSCMVRERDVTYRMRCAIVQGSPSPTLASSLHGWAARSSRASGCSAGPTRWI